jgi:hypothetical protein
MHPFFNVVVVNKEIKTEEALLSYGSLLKSKY